ncbi:MAG: hypothetical protein AB1782_13360 [Cyanobacteriota bacterium]
MQQSTNNPFNSKNTSIFNKSFYKANAINYNKSRWNRNSVMGFIEDNLKETPSQKLVFRSTSH